MYLTRGHQDALLWNAIVFLFIPGVSRRFAYGKTAQPQAGTTHYVRLDTPSQSEGVTSAIQK